MLPSRFWAKVDKEAPNGCWNWTGGRNSWGYGRASVDGRKRLVHRLAYEDAAGPVPSGLELDHLCENKLCVNPAHLEAVTKSENMARVLARRGVFVCGHPIGDGNTLLVNGGRWRKCRICNKRRCADRYTKARD